MISGVMRLADRSARGLMTPRLDVDVIDILDPYEENLAGILAARHSHLVVQEGDADTILGALAVADLLPALAKGEQADLKKLVRHLPVVMEHASAIDVMEAIRHSPVKMALVVDEYGHFEGIVTFGDVLEVITGVYDSEQGDEPAVVERQDGSWLVAGWMPVDDFAERFRITVPKDARYETLAGYILAQLNHLRLPGRYSSARVGASRSSISTAIASTRCSSPRPSCRASRNPL